uniref:Proline and serine-rich protein 2 n=1 Tax=Geotrypetes seraphini TaxID=260995 RepID=A0A6P8SE10_GEOSA|nr:proline and serine-rich protein 2 [Geotrypetes seraphini]XP_033814984.1 proline and serine-rich protein 2 [Geotrypetes seraphini]
MPRNLMNLGFSEMESGVPSNSGLSDFEAPDDGVGLRWSYHNDETLRFLTREERNVLLFFEETIESLRDDFDEPADNLDTSCKSSSPDLKQISLFSQSEPEDVIDLVQEKQEERDIEADVEPELAVEKISDPKPEPIETSLPDSISSSSAPVAIPVMTSSESDKLLPPDSPVDRPKLHGAIPTPVIIAQKICEKQVDNASPTPTSPKETRKANKKSVATSPMADGDLFFSYPAVASNKTRFPSNINVSRSGKEYNKTISKAAVNVQERKAQVLSNLNGASLLAEELEELGHRSEPSRQGKSSYFRDLTSEQVKYEALTKLGLVKETPVQVEILLDPVAQPASTSTVAPTTLSTPASMVAPTVLPALGMQVAPADLPAPVAQVSPAASPVQVDDYKLQHRLPESHEKCYNRRDNISDILKSEPSPFIPAGKTVTLKPEPVPAESKPARQSVSQCVRDPRLPSFAQDARRTSSQPRPSRFRPQSITVQFSGRDSSEEARRAALRKLGLLKETA